LKAIVVTPTYNEAENLPKLVEAILSLNLDNLEVLIVDDNSPDGTGQIADQLAERYPHKIEVIHRQGKLGLGTAYVTGFTRALEKGAEAIIEMDADLSHPPESIPKLLEKIKDHDVVIGSRYIPGGRVDPDLAPWRGFLSRAGNSYVRLITRLKVHDATAGFRCFRREVLQGIDLQRVRSTNYAFQIEMAYVCQRKGYRLVEVPISFRARSHGKSKISWRIVCEALWRAWEIRFRH
jgi:dolichol-phosphate mannosyltransferase